MADIVDFRIVAAKKAHAFLVGEIVKAAGGVNSGEERHVLGERHARGRANGAADVYKPRRRSHYDRDGRMGENLAGAIIIFDGGG